MAKVLILGGGLAGCTAARELCAQHKVVLVEKAGKIGGKVRIFGCKSSDVCNKCGVCLVGDLFERVEKDKRIELHTHSMLMDLSGSQGNYRATIKDQSGLTQIEGIDAVLVCVGFEQMGKASGSVETEQGTSVITGFELEALMARRGKTAVMENPPKSVAFVQCYGSRDNNEKARYCSRVCCGYSTRAAQVFRAYDPDMRITVFYMDLQQVEAGDYAQKLASKNIEMIRSKPIRVTPGTPASVVYDKPDGSGLAQEQFDLVVLSEGIHPPRDAQQLAELCSLSVDKDGFLKQANADRGVFIAGCASGPKKIVETYNDALTVSRELNASLSQTAR